MRMSVSGLWMDEENKHKKLCLVSAWRISVSFIAFLYEYFDRSGAAATGAAGISAGSLRFSGSFDGAAGTWNSGK